MPCCPQADLINQLYQGKLKDYVRCLECGYESWRIDTYLDIPLVIRPFGASQAYGSVVSFSLHSICFKTISFVVFFCVCVTGNMFLKLLFFHHRRRLCRHSSSQKLWMGPTNTSVNAAKRNVTPGR